MRPTIALLAGLLAAAPVPVAQAQQPLESAVESRRIAVTGSGTASARPDVMRVDLGVSVLGPEAGPAIERAGRRARAVIDALVDQGVEADDIQTQHYAVFPERTYEEGRTPKVTGWRVENVLTVTVRDLDRAGPILDAATTAAGDAALVRGVRFDIEDREALLEAARAEAFDDATDKARQLARLAEVELGRPLRIVEHTSAMPGPEPMMRLERADAAGTPIEAGEQVVTVSVEVDYAIAGPRG